jgi:LmbE family N-acetylglucosaminyl deacetylase
MPDTEEPEGPKRALIIAAHPDDADFGAAGVATLWGREGWEFSILVVTDGSKGTEDVSLTPDRLVPMRQTEQRAAGEVYGVKDCFFLPYTDGELTYSRQALGDVVRVVRQVKPHAVFTHDPEVIFHGEGFINHNDHRVSGLLATDAVYPSARDPLNFPEHLEEGLETHKVKEMYLWGTNQVNYVVDITTVVETKIEGLKRHYSQFGEGEFFTEERDSWWKDEEGRYVERFRRISLEF